MSKTQQALELIAAGVPPYTAAKQAGITPQAVYRAQARERAKLIKSGDLATCPCCGSLVKPEVIKGQK